ncbi:hypothetical protein DDZ18_12050 [Marinicauda salina]|uniref:Amidohydrolase-related domain-containing protein n=1 Tax=Marinicauda salina TaxID=2135793 RepID=A0A2U2BR95_9PROT|nr:amidohydrolase family protein [Marinicauda salina]PWE16498.1 hypothetical protein DDZ18_12050 [Marinicauda salina]
MPMQPLRTAAALLAAISTASCAQRAAEPRPMIDAHLHAAQIWEDDAAVRERVLESMDRNGVDLAALHLFEASDIEDWVRVAPDRFLAGPMFPCWRDESGEWDRCEWNDQAFPEMEWLRDQYERGTFSVMGELTFVYAGIAPDDPRMAPYWALAAELDIPVAVHINPGPPPGSPSRPEGCCPDFDPALGDPRALRPVLERHPDLRIWLQHAGMPDAPVGGEVYNEETLALLDDYENVYVDMTVLNTVPPKPAHAATLRTFVERGHADRIMMGTDNFPLGPVIERYRSFDFLTDDQLAGILGGNARRFFAPELRARR